MGIRSLFRRIASLGWFYGLSLAIAIGALVVFAKLADEVLEGDVRPLNAWVLRGLHAHTSRTLDTIATGLSRLGGPAGTTAVGGLGVLVFALRRRLLDAATLLLLLLGGTALSVVLKHSFRLPRPGLFVSIAPEAGYGFPSVHAMRWCPTMIERRDASTIPARSIRDRSAPPPSLASAPANDPPRL